MCLRKITSTSYKAPPQYCKVHAALPVELGPGPFVQSYVASPQVIRLKQVEHVKALCCELLNFTSSSTASTVGLPRAH